VKFAQDGLSTHPEIMTRKIPTFRRLDCFFDVVQNSLTRLGFLGRIEEVRIGLEVVESV
jgi:hypothetical protein